MLYAAAAEAPPNNFIESFIRILRDAEMGASESSTTPFPAENLLEDTVGHWCGGGASSLGLRLELLEDAGVVGMLPLPFYDWSCLRGGAIH